jgi:hypothetical protein
LVRSKSSLMTGIRGGAANVAKKAMKKHIQLRWKQRWCTPVNFQTLRTLDLQYEVGRGGGVSIKALRSANYCRRLGLIAMIWVGAQLKWERRERAALRLDSIATYLFSESTGIPKSTKSTSEFSKESTLGILSSVDDDLGGWMSKDSMFDRKCCCLQTGGWKRRPDSSKLQNCNYHQYKVIKLYA